MTQGMRAVQFGVEGSAGEFNRRQQSRLSKFGGSDLGAPIGTAKRWERSLPHRFANMIAIVRGVQFRCPWIRSPDPQRLAPQSHGLAGDSPPIADCMVGLIFHRVDQTVAQDDCRSGFFRPSIRFPVGQGIRATVTPTTFTFPRKAQGTTSPDLNCGV